VLDAALASTLVAMAEASLGVVVLERLPRAAGATRWFACASAESLQRVLDRLYPASRVSFYFDDRIAECPADDATTRGIAELLNEHGEVVLGWRSADGVEIEVELASSEREAVEALRLAGTASRVFVGVFPAADNDGTAAITAIVPDADGTVRLEPH
jgi:hypothetical protein